MMRCTETNIKELLPSYLEQRLSGPELVRIEKHLETCGDCREELELLRMMAEDAVPQPAESFWQEMPERVYREVRREKRARKRFALPDVLSGLVPPRWAWAAATVLMVAALSWFVFSPVRKAPVDVATSPGLEGIFGYEDAASDDAVNLSDISDTEASVFLDWTDRELAAIGSDAGETLAFGEEDDIGEELGALSSAEADKLLELLERSRQEV
jgi:hypothetical protein